MIRIKPTEKILSKCLAGIRNGISIGETMSEMAGGHWADCDSVALALSLRNAKDDAIKTAAQAAYKLKRTTCVLCGGKLQKGRCVSCKVLACRAAKFKAAMDKGKAEDNHVTPKTGASSWKTSNTSSTTRL